MDQEKELKKAEEKIDKIINLGQEIQKSAPIFVQLQGTFNWYEKALNETGEVKILEPIKEAIGIINGINIPDFTRNDATGSLAFTVSATATTVNIIEQLPVEYHFLEKELEEINPTEKLIEQISETLQLIDVTSAKLFKDVERSYSEWKTGLKTNSDLSKDIRTFHEDFIGALNEYRIPKEDWSENINFPDLSWPKMVKVIAKKGAKYERKFMIEKTNRELLKSELTHLMKKKKEITRQDMEIFFKRFIEHIFTVVNLVDENIYIKKS